MLLLGHPAIWQSRLRLLLLLLVVLLLLLLLLLLLWLQLLFLLLQDLSARLRWPGAIRQRCQSCCRCCQQRKLRHPPSLLNDADLLLHGRRRWHLLLLLLVCLLLLCRRHCLHPQADAACEEVQSLNQHSSSIRCVRMQAVPDPHWEPQLAG